MKKNKCPRCGREIESRYDFCPYCGNSLDNKNKWGMLGKNDSFDFQNPSKPDLFNGGIIGKMLGSAMKMLEKELQKETQNKNFQNPKSNFQLYINGKKVGFKKENIPKRKKQEPIKQKIYVINAFSEKQQKKFSELEKQEPETSVRRLSDRIIFEINIPEIKSMKDISIKKLENSIEIKALTKNKSYYKIIQIGLPVIDYRLDKEKLILELKTK